MLLLTPENTRWRRASYIILALLVAYYYLYPSSASIYGGSPQGLAYGTLGLAITLFLFCYGLRKRSYKMPWGTVEGWLHAHVYLGLITVAVILLHTGFRFHDKVAVSALVLLCLVALSGSWGAVLYTLIPPRMNSVKTNLTTVELADQINEIGRSMAWLATGKSQPFQAIYRNLFEAEKPPRLAGWRSLSRRFLQRRLAEDPSGSFDPYVGRVPPEEQMDLTQMLALAHQRNDLHDCLIQRQRYVNLMAAWLYLHVPLSFAMLVMVAAHLFAFFYYG
jgi:hypothetical protein